MQPRLVKCTKNDIRKLVQLSTKTFREAFEVVNNPDDFEAYISKAFNEEKLQEELSNSDSTFFFIYLEERISGYIKVNVGSAQTDIHDEDAMELERIYVLKEFQGKKLGTWALHKVLELARESHKQYVWLGVWEQNHRAIRFYQNHGFIKFGEHPYYIGNDRQNDWLMRHDVIQTNTSFPI